MLSQEKIFFLSINYAFWYFDDRKPWNINHIGYPATDKNKKHLLFWLGSDSSLSDQTSIEEKKKKEKNRVFYVWLKAAAIKLSKEKVKHRGEHAG